jgi:hypothetical protein
LFSILENKDFIRDMMTFNSFRVNSLATRWLFFFCGTDVWTQGLHLEPLCQSFFVLSFFRDRVLWTLCPGWLRTMIVLISASWVARITEVSHQHRLFLNLFFLQIRSHYVGQAGFQFVILLPLTPKCWDYRHKPPYLVDDILI